MKKADRREAAMFLNRRYAAIAEATPDWLDMPLSKTGHGFTVVVESGIKQALKGCGRDGSSDIMFSYLLGKYDSKNALASR